MEEPMFDIFKGEPKRNAIWLECVVGLSAAQRRMEQIASENPGQYFLFSVQSRSLLAKVDSGRTLQELKSELTTASAA